MPSHSSLLAVERPKWFLFLLPPSVTIIPIKKADFIDLFELEI
ncbi:MAG: hypothetical protein ABIH59_03810 [archaeon]